MGGHLVTTVRRLQNPQGHARVRKLVEVGHHPGDLGGHEMGMPIQFTFTTIDQPGYVGQQVLPAEAMERIAQRLGGGFMLQQPLQQHHEGEDLPRDGQIGAGAAVAIKEVPRLISRLWAAYHDEGPLFAQPVRIGDQLIGGLTMDLHGRHQHHLQGSTVDGASARPDVG
jgi:hypothetical protein